VWGGCFSPTSSSSKPGGVVETRWRGYGLEPAASTATVSAAEAAATSAVAAASVVSSAVVAAPEETVVAGAARHARVGSFMLPMAPGAAAAERVRRETEYYADHDHE
jgi:hypothetical protein